MMTWLMQIDPLGGPAGSSAWFVTFLTGWAYACLVSTYLLRVLWTPEEIPARWYVLLYNLVRRLAGNSSWKPVKPKSTES